MNKFTRYVGLGFSLTLLLLLIPVKVGYFHATTKLTPFDNSAFVRLVTQNSEKFRFWREGSHYINTCKSPVDCKQLVQFIELNSYFGSGKLNDVQPELDTLYKEAFSTGTTTESPQRQKYYQQALDATNKYLDRIEPAIRIQTYSLILLLVLTSIFGVICREAVGRTILIPFIQLKRLLFASGKVAKDVHDKI